MKPNEDDIVVSGISGRFPNSDNIEEFWCNLISGNELCSADDRRWPVGFMGTPPISGKMKEISKIDAEFFKMCAKEAEFLDPQYRVLHEVVYEAIYDAGLIPETLRGSKTAVLVGECVKEVNHDFGRDLLERDKDRALVENDCGFLALTFGFKSAAFKIDTACASSFSCFNEGINMIKARHCENLVIGGVSLNLTPKYTMLLTDFKMIAPDGKSKCLDSSVDGYCRSEAVVAFFVQRRKYAKRIYASVMACKTNTDGFKADGISFPGFEGQARLLKQTIDASGIDPLSINYIEAHITGTSVGDVVESRSILAAYREQSTKPIMFGCLKSNMGHTESVSALCAITKISLIFQKHCIPPNLNYKNPNPNIEGLIQKIIIPVLEKRNFNDEIIPVNSFGLGGVNVHAIFKANERVIGEDSYKIIDDIPRIVNISGRTEEGVNHIVDWIFRKRSEVTKEFLSLLNDVSKTPLETGMIWRGFAILDEKNILQKKVSRNEQTRPLWFIFPSFGCQWGRMGKELMKLKRFKESIESSARTLKSKNIDLVRLLFDDNIDLDLNVVDAFVSIVSIQIAMIDLLYFFGIKANGFIGYSIGEIAAGYADGCLTAEEALQVAYHIAKCCCDLNSKKGMMAEIGLSWEEARNQCLYSIFPACDNSDNCITVSGAKTDVKAFIEKMRSENVFAKELMCFEMAYHSPVMKECYQSLAAVLNEVIEAPKLRSQKWNSTSVGNEEDGKLCDAQYYANNVLSPVLLNKCVKKIPENACIVEVGPDSILIPLIKHSLPSCSFVSLMKRFSNRCLLDFLAAIGDIYCSGQNPAIESIYAKVEYPVPRETASLSHLLRWDHSKTYFVPKFPKYFSQSQGKTYKVIDLMTSDLQFIEDHCMDGRILFPAIGYFYYTWRQYAINCGFDIRDKIIEFKNVTFHRATIIEKGSTIRFDILINKDTGRFEIKQRGVLCVTGTIRHSQEAINFDMSMKSENNTLKLDSKSIYKEFRIRGFDYGPTFQALIEASSDGSRGKVKWTGNEMSFIDAIFQLPILASDDRTFRLGTFIEYFSCDPRVLFKEIKKNDVVDIYFDKSTNTLWSKMVIVKGVKATPIPRRQDQPAPTLELENFSPYDLQIFQKDEEIEMRNKFCEICVSLLQKLHLKERKHINFEKLDHNELNERKCSFYEKLKFAVVKGLTTNEFLANLTDEDKAIFFLKSNFEYLVRDCIKIAIENTSDKFFNVVEYNETWHKLRDEITEIFKYQLLIYNYTSLPEKNEKTIPNSIKNVNLIVYKNESSEFVKKELSIKSKGQLRAFLSSCHRVLRNDGFLILLFRDKLTEVEEKMLEIQSFSIPKLNFEKDLKLVIDEAKFKIVCERKDNFGFVSIILKKIERLRLLHNPIVIEIRIDNYEWIEKIKKELKVNRVNRIWLKSSEEINGVRGLTRCLRKEVGGHRIRCFIGSEDEIPQNVLEKDLVMNIIKDSECGTYIHRKMQTCNNYVATEHAYLDIKTKGDLSSLCWYEASHKHWNTLTNTHGQNLINCVYSSLNFKDVMIASNRLLSSDSSSFGKRLGSFGFEFAGIDVNGRRVFGFCAKNAIATTLVVEKNDFVLPVPDNWTLEEAATVPVVYATVYFALCIRAHLKKGETVLIHAGSGEVGQAAISMCLAMGCEVFTSAGTEEERRLILKTFPQLEENHILNSRDVTFEEHILKQTNGEGVEVIFNSLTEEKFQASINCLAEFGRFIEIGTYDLTQNNLLDPIKLTNSKTFHVVSLEYLMFEVIVNESKTAIRTLMKIKEMIEKGINDETVRPLPRTTFGVKEIEKAFRFIVDAKHIGKVLIRIRDENKSSFPPKPVIEAISQTFCHPEKVYILIGGLGGMGLELSYWLIKRGAKKLVLTSRTGIKHNYQRFMIEKMEAEGAHVMIKANDALTYELALQLINKANELGPIGGIFNVAMVYFDALLENQTEKSFVEVCKPKVNASRYLDEITRKLGIRLDYFVCFSSFICGRGNTGQSSYGFANSVMESICEKRRNDNLHGLAIQWGTVGDVGYANENFQRDDVVGTKQQRIHSCLSVLDFFINSPHAICSSIVFNEIRDSTPSKKVDLFKYICHLFGVSDSSAIDEDITLGNLGMDSLMAVEIRQCLDRDFNTVMEIQELRKLTLREIRGFSSKLAQTEDEKNCRIDKDDINVFELSKNLFLRLNAGKKGDPIFVFPPIEGNLNLLKPLIRYFKCEIFSINWIEELYDMPTIEKIAAFYAKKLIEEHSQLEYEFVAYSFGSIFAFEVALQLQKIDDRLVKKLIILDGDLNFLKAFAAFLFDKQKLFSENEAFKNLLTTFISLLYSPETVENLKQEINALKTKEDQLRKTVDFMNSLCTNVVSQELFAQSFERFHKKLNLILDYVPSSKFKGDVKLIISTSKSEMFDITSTASFEEFQKLIEGSLEVIQMPGNHFSFLKMNSEALSDLIQA